MQHERRAEKGDAKIDQAPIDLDCAHCLRSMCSLTNSRLHKATVLSKNRPLDRKLVHQTSCAVLPRSSRTFTWSVLGRRHCGRWQEPTSNLLSQFTGGRFKLTSQIEPETLRNTKRKTPTKEKPVENCQGILVCDRKDNLVVTGQHVQKQTVLSSDVRKHEGIKRHTLSKLCPTSERSGRNRRGLCQTFTNSASNLERGLDCVIRSSRQSDGPGQSIVTRMTKVHVETILRKLVSSPCCA